MPNPDGTITMDEAEAILNRQMGATSDPTLLAVIRFVESMTDAAVREASGFHTASSTNNAKDWAKAQFVHDMEKAATLQEG